jgi:hypothetical protein
MDLGHLGTLSYADDLAHEHPVEPEELSPKEIKEDTRDQQTTGGGFYSDQRELSRSFGFSYRLSQLLQLGQDRGREK